MVAGKNFWQVYIFVIDNILSETICPACFCALFSIIIQKKGLIYVIFKADWPFGKSFLENILFFFFQLFF